MSRTSREEIEQVFKSHVPFVFPSYMIDLFCSKGIILKLKPNRKTKLGDLPQANCYPHGPNGLIFGPQILIWY